MSFYSLDSLNSFIVEALSCTTPPPSLDMPATYPAKDMASDNEDSSAFGEGKDTRTQDEAVPVKAESAVKESSLPEILKPSKSKGANHLKNKSFTKPAGGDLFFDSYHTSTTAYGQAQWRPPIDDSSIPQTPEAEQATVRLLFDALCDVDNANDTMQSPYRARFGSAYEEWVIKASAWELLVSYHILFIPSYHIF